MSVSRHYYKEDCSVSVDDEGTTVQPWPTLLEESKKHVQHRLFDLGLSRISRGVALDPTDPDKLTWRSQCNVRRFDATAALDDAVAACEKHEELLQDPPLESPTTPKPFLNGLFSKAEALYHQKQFEDALILYNQCAAAFPTNKKYKLASQRTKYAIFNSLGELSKVHFDDLKELVPLMQKYTSSDFAIARRRLSTLARIQFIQPDSVACKASHILGPIHKDKVFVSKRVKKYQKVLKTELCTDGDKLVEKFKAIIAFVEQRDDFWRHHKPNFARNAERIIQNERLAERQAKERKKEREILEQKRDTHKRHIEESLKRLDKHFKVEAWPELLQLGNYLAKYLNTTPEYLLTNKYHWLSVTQNFIAHAYMELDSYDKAMGSNEKMLDAAKKTGLESLVRQALCTIGKTHARFGKYRWAATNWEAMIPMTRNLEQRAWLFHDLCRCYFELDKVEAARMYAGWSLDAAESAGNNVWQSRAYLLIAMTERKLGDNSAAIGAVLRAKACGVEEEDVSEKLDDLIHTLLTVKDTKATRRMTIHPFSR